MSEWTPRSKYGFRPAPVARLELDAQGPGPGCDVGGSDATIPKPRTDLGGDVEHYGTGDGEDYPVREPEFGTITDGWGGCDDGCGEDDE